MIERDTVYRWLLHAYPRAFRREFGDDIVRDLEALHHDARRGRLSFWPLVLRDVAVAASREHLDVWTCGMRGLALRWLCGCTVATALSGMAIFLFMTAFSLVFPPYVGSDGLMHRMANNFPPAVYGVLVGLVIGGGQAFAARTCVRPALWTLASAVATGLGMPAGLAVANHLPRSLGQINYFIGVAVLGIIVGLAQSALVDSAAARVRWSAWTTASTVIAVMVVVAAERLVFHANPRTLSGLLLGFFGYPAVIGLVMGALTVRPLTAIAASNPEP